MNSKIIIYALLLSGPIYAMREPLPMALPGANESQLNVVCPGHQLERQPDHRQLVHIHDKSYYLVERDGRGLSDHDIKRLRQIVPFAVNHALHNMRSAYGTWKWLVGGFVGGFLLYAWIFRDQGRFLPLWRRCLLIGKQAFWAGLSGLGVTFSYATIPPSHLYNTSDAENNLYGKVSADISAKDLPCHSSRDQDCLPPDQHYHLRHAKCSRMALGNLYVPAADRKQLENTDNPRKPLETFLLRANSPINELLQIPLQYRGNRVFVQSIMKFIEDCELSGNRYGYFADRHN